MKDLQLAKPKLFCGGLKRRKRGSLLIRARQLGLTPKKDWLCGVWFTVLFLGQTARAICNETAIKPEPFYI